jgi:hypothetical protein
MGSRGGCARVGELDPSARTPDLRWLRPPGRMSTCLHLTLLSSVVERSSWLVWASNRAQEPVDCCVVHRCSSPSCELPVVGRPWQAAAARTSPRRRRPPRPERPTGHGACRHPWAPDTSSRGARHDCLGPAQAGQAHPAGRFVIQAGVPHQALATTGHVHPGRVLGGLIHGVRSPVQ